MMTARRLGLRLACAGLVLLGSAPLFADAGDPPATVARLGGLEGSVSVQPAGVNEWSQADVNYPVATGDRVYADQDGRAELGIGQTVARMWHNTDLTMTNLNDQITQLGLAQGTLRLRTFTLSDGQVEVDTPNGAITVTRPGDIRIDSNAEDGGTVVEVNSGAVEVTGPNLSQEIGAGQAVRLEGSNPIEIGAVEMPGLDQFDHWSIERDKRAEDSQSARYVNRETVGYDDLDDYGSWTPDTEYGPVWYPREVPADWAPYRMGHWVWTGPWGWTWVEDEPWGYAPFHYGRWAYIDSRWGWVPGPIAVRPVWSPALVAFAGGGVSVAIGFGDVAAWFPLGVGEPYVPWYHCSPDYVRRVNVTNINIVNIHNTTIVNNYNNFVRNSDNYRNLDNVREARLDYSNRVRGFTAVNQHAFSSAQPVARNLVSIPAERIRTAQVIAHPSIRPTAQAVVPHPTRAVPVPAARPTLLTQGGRMAQAVPNARPQPVPYRPLAQNTAGGRGVAPNNGALPNRGVVPNNGAVPNRGLPNGGVQNGGLPNRGLPNSGLPNRGPEPVARPGMNGGGNVGAVPQNRPVAPAAGARPNAPNETMPQRPLITRSGGTTMPGRPLPPPQSERQPAINNAQPRPAQGGSPVQAQPRPTPGATAAPGQRPLITRNETPAQRPSFDQQRRAMPDAGRPLEPQQIDNVRQGRPAGPSQDREAYPHSAPAPQQRYSAPPPQPQQRYSPPPQERAQPQPQQRYSPPPQPQQQRYSAPPQPQQQRYSPPPQERAQPQPQQRYSPPPQERAAPPQQRSAPPQQQQREAPRDNRDHPHR